MKAFSPIMMQYQHPFTIIGLPPIVLASLAFIAFMVGLLVGIFFGVASAFIAGVTSLLCLYIGFKLFARNDRHAERVFLFGLIYWLDKKGHYSSGVGK